jgi:hypothetical protein
VILGAIHHFGHRKLSSLKSRKRVAVVETLGDLPAPLPRCPRAGVRRSARPMKRALADLAAPT